MTSGVGWSCYSPLVCTDGGFLRVYLPQAKDRTGSLQSCTLHVALHLDLCPLVRVVTHVTKAGTNLQPGYCGAGPGGATQSTRSPPYLPHINSTSILSTTCIAAASVAQSPETLLHPNPYPGLRPPAKPCGCLSRPELWGLVLLLFRPLSPLLRAAVERGARGRRLDRPRKRAD